MKNCSFLVLCLSLLFTVSCKKKEKTSWDTNWQLPLVEDTLSLENLADEQDVITVNGGVYELSIDRDLFSLRLSDMVKIPDTSVTHNYAINIGGNGITVNPGVSFVNNIQEHDFNIEPTQLKAMWVKSGGIQVRVESPIETTTIFKVELPGVVKNGQTYIQEFTVPPGTNANPSSITDYVDLTGYQVDLTGQYGTSFNKLQSKLTVKSDPAGSVVSVNNLDSLRFVFTMDELRLDYARGYFGSQTFSDTLNKTIDVLTQITDGTIDLDAANLNFEIENGFKLSARAKLISLKNTNAQGSTVALSHSSVGSWINVNPAYGNYSNLTSTYTNIDFNGGNSNVEQFLENHGAQNEIAYQLQVNPWGNVSGGWDEVYDSRPMNIHLTGNLPLNIGATNLTILDTFSFSLNQNYDATHVESGDLIIDVDNAFPMQADLMLYFLDANGNVITQFVANNSIASSVYGQLVNGIQQKKSTISMTCSASQVELLNSAKKVCVKAVLNTPDVNTNLSTQVSIPENAFLKFKIRAKIAVKHNI